MDGSVAITDVSTGNVIAQFKKHEKYVVSVKWSYDGNTLASASHDHSLNIYQRAGPDSPFEFIDKYDYAGNVEALTFHKVLNNQSIT
jgi:WD40 repeat protein